MSSFSPVKTAAQPLNLMKYSPKLANENSSSSKSPIDVFTTSSNNFKSDGDTLINFIRQCYLPSELTSLSASDKLKADLLMATNKPDSNDDNLSTNCQSKESNQKLNKINQINELNKINETDESSNKNLDQQQSTKLDAGSTHFLSKLAKETSSNFANFSIETILASRRKHLTELAHLSDPFTNNQLNLNAHLNHLQNYHQHYQQTNLLQQQQQQLFNHTPTSTNIQPILNLHSQLFNLAAANSLTNSLDSKFHHHSSLQNSAIHLPQLTSSTTPSTTLSNGSSLSNETSSSLAMLANESINKFTGNLIFCFIS